MEDAGEPAEVHVEPIPDAEVEPPPQPFAEQRSGEGRQSIVYDGVELSLASTLGALRAACTSAGLSKSGGKQRCRDRLKGYLEKQRIALQAEVAQTVESDSKRAPRPQAITREPTAAERALHELTHWPYQAWCAHCVSMRAIQDRYEALPQGSDRDTPVLSFDICYTGVSEQDGSSGSSDASNKLTILVAHDTGAGSILGLPLPTKSKTDLRFAAVELTRFVQSLGRNTITIQCDNEPSTLALQDLVVGVRTRLGFKTIVRDVAVEAHASNGHAEKAVDLLRGLSNVLLDQLRSKFGVNVGPDHPLMAWSYVHASFILNRFAVRGGVAAFERSTGYPVQR